MLGGNSEDRHCTMIVQKCLSNLILLLPDECYLLQTLHLTYNPHFPPIWSWNDERAFHRTWIGAKNTITEFNLFSAMTAEFSESNHPVE